MGFGKGALTLIITRTLGPRPHVSLAAFSLPYCSASFDSHGGLIEGARGGPRGREAESGFERVRVCERVTGRWFRSCT